MGVFHHTTLSFCGDSSMNPDTALFQRRGFLSPAGTKRGLCIIWRITPGADKGNADRGMHCWHPKPHPFQPNGAGRRAGEHLCSAGCLRAAPAPGAAHRTLQEMMAQSDMGTPQWDLGGSRWSLEMMEKLHGEVGLDLENFFQPK